MERNALEASENLSGLARIKMQIHAVSPMAFESLARPTGCHPLSKREGKKIHHREHSYVQLFAIQLFFALAERPTLHINQY